MHQHTREQSGGVRVRGVLFDAVSSDMLLIVLYFVHVLARLEQAINVCIVFSLRATAHKRVVRAG
jgi:hypothetical protein